MIKLQMLLALAVLVVSSGSQAQVLIKPFRINKTVQKMQLESAQARKFFTSVLDETAPSRLDLLKYQSPVRDQGHRGTCVAFATMAQMEAMMMIKNNKAVDLSEQYSYWASKAVDKIAPNSDGSDPLMFLKSVEKNGVPVEQFWPYESTGWYDDEIKHPDCYNANKKNSEMLPTPCVTNGNAPVQAQTAPKLKISEPHHVPSSPEAIMGFLQSGVPVQIAVDVYQNAWGFHDKKSQQYITGVVAFPAPNDKLIGGHAILVVGYDRDSKVFLFKNSWGTDAWASKSRYPGYGLISFDYVRKYAEAAVAKL